jgi:hypothetical protein
MINVLSLSSFLPLDPIKLFQTNTSAEAVTGLMECKGMRTLRVLRCLISKIVDKVKSEKSHEDMGRRN